MQRQVAVELGQRRYEVTVGSGALTRVGSIVDALGRPGPLLVVSDERVEAAWGASLRASLATLADTGWPEPRWLLLPQGETHKSIEQVARIWDAALDMGADRSLVVVAFGGGVVGDLAGFAAASLLRGVRLVMVPTTLLAQVDSSVGGKTGFNRAQGKNLVGAFHQPAAVIADPEVLGTLDERDYRAGLGEVIKYGASLDAPLFDLLGRQAVSLIARSPALLTEVVARCCELKAEVVVADEREAGLRQVLNFGHTVGHAIEKLGAYERHRHGEAVAIGMVAAARLGADLGVSDKEPVDRICTLLQSFGLPRTIPAYMGRAGLSAAIGFDKTRRGDQVRWILCPKIGHWVARDLTAATAVDALLG